MTQVIIAKNSIDPKTWETYEADNVCDFIITQFDKWPDTARVYSEYVAQICDVTPNDEASIERLNTLPGPIYVIVFPHDPVTIIVGILISVALSAISYLLQPKISEPPVNAAIGTEQRNIQATSPNNALSARTNNARLNSRIPDIFGTVRSTPDMLALTYSVFENNKEVEYSYMCIGRGSFDVSDVKDDTTLISSIAGSSVAVYGPDTSPNTGDAPQLLIGDAITEPVLNVTRSGVVNGQVLIAPNAGRYVGAADVRFVSPDTIQTNNTGAAFSDLFAVSDNLNVSNAATSLAIAGSSDIRFISSNQINTSNGAIDFRNLFVAGSTVVVSGAAYDFSGDPEVPDISDYSGSYVISAVAAQTITVSGSPFAARDLPYLSATLRRDFDLSGTYDIIAVSSDTITLSSPNGVNAAWNALAFSPTAYISPTLDVAGERWIGPFIIPDMAKVYTNFVAVNGMYKDNGSNQFRTDVQLELEITPINSSNIPTGAAEVFTASIIGSSIIRDQRAITLKATATFTGRCSIRARRVTDKDFAFSGQVVDEVKWRDLYAVKEVGEIAFGNVTTVHSKTIATFGTLSVKSRKLNMLVQRKIKTRVSGSTFTSDLHATNRVDEIISAICLDEHLGRRTVGEIDFDSIYSSIADIETYFGTALAIEFNYTFDASNISFEELIAMVSSSSFCTSYRRGSVFKLAFEKQTENSTLLFNHRNKHPGSETRTITFGNQNDYDGIQLNYIDPMDDAIITFYLPSDQSARNPKKIDTVGIRSKLKAYFHAYRAWNKIRYQRVVTSFVTLQEADLAVLQDRILVADNTRTSTQDGYVTEQNITQLTLSQNVVMDDLKTYTIFLQHIDGTVQAIEIASKVSDKVIVLSEVPTLPLSVDADNYAQAKYMIVANDDPREQAFLLTEKNLQDSFAVEVNAVNYDDRYYANDGDYIGEIVDVDGNLI